MELDLEGQFVDRAYPILASRNMRRPVTALSPAGKVNPAPSHPPILAVAPGDRDDGTPKDCC